VHRNRFVLFLGLGAVVAAVAAAKIVLADAQITGAGSSFDNPFFARAFYTYGQDHGNVQVNYQPIGSGGGIQQFTQKLIDFGATDVPLTAAEMNTARAANGDVVQVPVTLGGVAIAYNVPGAQGTLKLTPDVLANISLGTIASWNDPRIAGLNPGMNLPNLPIVVVHRADGSGTTYIFTDYLSKISSTWKTKVGNSKLVSWPAASSVGAKGNEGVARQVQGSPGAIGYIELAYALVNHIPYAAVRNRAGAFVAPSEDTVRGAAAQKPNVNPTDFSIVDMPGPSSYPICGYSWVMLWKSQADANKGKQLVDLFRWLVSDGQSYAVQVRYVSLPPNVRAEAMKALADIR
jgi:phosphate transport system substrate-binding protein